MGHPSDNPDASLPLTADEKSVRFLQAGRAASACYFFIIAMALGGGGGWLVDHYVTHRPPWGLLTGFFLGITAGFRELWLIARNTRFGTTTESGPPQPKAGTGEGA